MTVTAGFFRFFLILSTVFSTICLTQPGFSEENSKMESQTESSATLLEKNHVADDKKVEPISKDNCKTIPNLSETQEQYLGNKFSRKYHLKGCHFAQIADPANIFPFGSCKEAIKSKYLPCNWCLPKWQKFVKGQIIGLPINREADAKKSSSQ